MLNNLSDLKDSKLEEVTQDEKEKNKGKTEEQKNHNNEEKRLHQTL